MTDPGRLIKLIRDALYARLERKTGWGREELKLEFEHAVTDALGQLTIELMGQVKEN